MIFRKPVITVIISLSLIILIVGVTIAIAMLRSPHPDITSNGHTAIHLAPSNLSANSQANKNIKLTWNGTSSTADGYEIWRTNRIDQTPFTKLSDVTPSTTMSYVDNSTKIKGSTYTYKLRAHKTIGTERNYSDYTATDSAKAND